MLQVQDCSRCGLRRFKKDFCVDSRAASGQKSTCKTCNAVSEKEAKQLRKQQDPASCAVSELRQQIGYMTSELEARCRELTLLPCMYCAHPRLPGMPTVGAFLDVDCKFAQPAKHAYTTLMVCEGEGGTRLDRKIPYIAYHVDMANLGPACFRCNKAKGDEWT